MSETGEVTPSDYKNLLKLYDKAFRENAELKKDLAMKKLLANTSDKLLEDKIELIAHIERLRGHLTHIKWTNSTAFNASIEKLLKETPKQSLARIRKDAYIEFACYLLDNHEVYFPQGEEEIQRICARAVDSPQLRKGE